MSRFEQTALASEASGVLEILAPDGSLARYSAKLQLTLSDVLEERWIEIASDGKADLLAIAPGQIKETLELSGGSKFLIRYEPPLSPGSYIFTTTMEFRRAFLGRDEFYTIFVKYPIRHLKVDVKFPEGVLVTSASVVRIDRSARPIATEVPESRPSLNLEENNRYEIHWSKEDPRVNSEYRIKWSWCPVVPPE